MTKIDKLIARLLTRPKDFTFDEACKVLSYFGFKMSNKGKTSGSRVEFVKDKDTILIHKPHPSGVLKHYVVSKFSKLVYTINIVSSYFLLMFFLILNGIFIPLFQSHSPLCSFTQETNILVQTSKITIS